MSNVLTAEKRQQVLALGRLGWSLRRIKEAAGVRRETASSYLKAAGLTVRGRGRPPARPAKPAISSEVSTDSSVAPAAGTVPAGRAVDDATRTPRRTHTSSAWGGDLRAAQENQSVNCLERNPLATLRVRNQQCPSAMLHAGAMIPNVHRAQVAHPNTVLVIYRFTLRGAVVSSGRQ